MSAPLTLIAIFVSFNEVICRYTDEAEFTIAVKPYSEECFFQEANKDKYLEVEYQVLDGNLDSLNIDFTVTSSLGRQLASDTAQSEGTHRLLIPSDGALKICLDNRPYSSLKSVYIEVFVEDGDSDDEHAGDDDPFELGTITLAPDTGFNSSDIDQMRHRISRISEHLNGAQRYQEWQKAHEARHRNLIERLFTVLNTLSALQIAIMVTLLFFEVKVIEKFFQQDSMFSRLRTWFAS